MKWLTLWIIIIAEPIFRENKYKLYEINPPDPLKDNLMKRVMEFFDYINEQCKNLEFERHPVIGPTTVPGEWTDGPFTVAGKLRGLTEIFFDMVDDEKYFFDLMNFVTENIIRRMKEIRKWRWKREGNNLAPLTPIENIVSMYQATKMYGRYPK